MRKNGEIRRLEVFRKEVLWNGKPHFQVLYQDVTARKQAEQALRESEQRFYRLANNAQDMIYRYLIVPQRRFDYMSPASITVTGYTPEEHYADPDLGFKMVHPDDRPLWYAYLRDTGKWKESITLRWIRKDGSEIWTEQRNVPIYDQKGELLGLEGIARDITERKRAENALRESEERYRRLAENAPDVIVRHEFLPKRRYAFVSPAATAISGYTPEEYYADPDLGFKLVHPDDQAALQSLFRSGGRTGMHEIMRWVRKDGVTIWIEQHSIPVYDAERNVVAIESICRDITQRKQAEDMLVSLTTSSPIGIYTIEDGKFQFVNPRFQELLGYRENELLGTSPLMLVFPEDVAKVRENAAKMLRGEQTTPYEYRYVTKDGETRWVLERVASINYLGKQATLGNFMDITQRKLMEEELLQKEVEMATARETDRLKNQMLSTVSHELRTPLASIKGYSTMLLDYNRKLKQGQKQESLEAINRSADRLAELIDHLLDMSRLDAGLFRLSSTPYISTS